MRIVFMGTPDFAVPSLERILEEGHQVVGVFTQPDKPRGRSAQLQPPPVKVLALERGLPVFQPAKMRDGQALGMMKELAPDLVVVVAYGKILPKDLLEVPPLGCVNVHGSLLPRYRGAAPIQWSVINGDPVTGVTTMFMAEGLDTGDIILTMETPIGPGETGGSLFDRLAPLGAQCLAKTLDLFEAGQVPRVPQDEAKATYAPILSRETGVLDLARPAPALECLVRGVTPWPGASLRLEGKLLKVLEVRLAQGQGQEPGVLLAEDRFVVSCGAGALELVQVQPEGKRPMAGADYLRGRRMKIGTSLMGDSHLDSIIGETRES